MRSQFELFYSSYKRIAFTLLIFSFFITPLSCTGRYDKTEEKNLINELYSANFFQVLNPQNKLLEKLNNTDDGSLYYIGLYLKQDRSTRGSAKEFFNYASKHSKAPYNKLARDQLYLLSANDEKLKIISDIIDDKTISFKEKDKAQEKRKRLFFLLKKFNKLDKSPAEYLASIKLDSELNRRLESLFLEKDNKTIKKAEKTNKGFKKITKARILVSKRQYDAAWEIFLPILESKETYKYIESRNILSDLGKAAVFSSGNYEEKAELFEKLLRNIEEKSFEVNFKKMQKYMYAFYTARLNLKLQKTENTEKAIDFFKHSLNYATTESDFDNSLWYYLDTLKEKSFNKFFEELCKSSKDWKDAYFYEDLVAYTSMQLVKRKDEKRFKEFTNSIEKTDLREAQARNSYVLARLNEVKRNQVNNQDLYARVCDRQHNFFYYKILADYSLNKSQIKYSDELIFSYSRYGNAVQPENRFPAEQCLKVLNGLVKYKLYSEIYRHIYAIYSGISVEQAENFAKILAEQKYYPESIKVMNFALRRNNAEASKAQLKLIYPRPYQKEVKKYAKEFNVPEYLLFGLIRSESFFRAKVRSHAGAIGLSQLMKPTAKDIARRLKIKEYDLEDPNTNIKFGAYYLSKMIAGKDGNIMAALFSYNAGPNAVRRWQRKFKNFPNDLFLELVPYNETRGYGRKVFTASTIYAELYYGKKYSEVVKEFFRF